MRKRSLVPVAVAAIIGMATPAYAHVTIQPDEAIAGSFARFVVRVPNERDDASTVKVRVEMPPLAFVSFEGKDGWQRSTQTVEFDEPLEAFDSEITEGIGSVTWKGGEVGPGEFAEFGFSAAMPADETTLTFRAIQTYSSGEVVEWTGSADSESPAPELTTYDLGGVEGAGQLGVLDRVADEIAADEGGSTEDAASDTGVVDEGDEDDDGTEALPVALGAAGVALGLIALIVALSKRRAG